MKSAIINIITGRLIEYASGKIVLYHKFNKTSTLDERDLNLFASEISNIFQEEIREFAHQIETYLSENLPGLPAE
jgi:ABC-type glutathione transport system ATPase component